jgi:hypothetical protein
MLRPTIAGHDFIGGFESPFGRIELRKLPVGEAIQFLLAPRPFAIHYTSFYL